jgi:hypothetical protein
MVDKVGDYNLTVRTETGKDIARVTFKGTRSAFHPWSPLLLTKNEEYERLGDAHQYRRTMPAKASYEGKGIALPNMESSIGYSADGFHPKWQKHLRDRGEKPEPMPFKFGKGDLPRVLPQDVDPDLKVKFSQDRMLIHIAITGEIYLPRPDWQFLCRWWVNGKPFVPEQVDPIPMIKGGTTIYPTEEKDLQIELKLMAKALNARSGDEVELQLLHCPCSWLPVENPQGNEKAGRGYPRLSNKVSFKLP